MDSTNNDFKLFHKDRIKSSIDEVQKEYLKGKKIFDKYDIEDNFDCFNGLVLDGAQFYNCIIEACFLKCSFNNSYFSNCNLKTIKFTECNLTNTVFEECSIESTDFDNSILDGVKFGVNYAYGAKLDSDSLSKIYILKENTISKN